MPTLLCLCVANSARSQLAEAIARSLAPPGWTILSAGSQPGARVHPLALDALAALGVSTEGLHPKGFDKIPWPEVDTALRLCAEESCPLAPRAEVGQAFEVLDWSVPDPAVEGATVLNFIELAEKLKTRFTNFFASHIRAKDKE